MSTSAFTHGWHLCCRERAAGLFGTPAYFTAMALFDLVPMRVVPPCFFAASTYWMIGFRPGAAYLPSFWLTLVLSNMVRARLHCLAWRWLLHLQMPASSKFSNPLCIMSLWSLPCSERMLAWSFNVALFDDMLPAQCWSACWRVNVPCHASVCGCVAAQARLCSSQVGASMNMAVGAAAPSSALANLFGSLAVLLSILFGGFLLSRSQMPAVVAWMAKLSFVR